MSGEHHRTISIGGLSLDIALTLDSMIERVEERYAGFLGDASPEMEITLEIDASAPCFHPVWVDNPPVEAEGDLGIASLRGEGLSAVIDWDARRAQARIPDSLAHLDLIVRIVLGGLLLREGGTLLHAAAVRHDGFGLIFCGPSGAGKSTLAKISREAGEEILSDEMVVVRRSGQGVRVFGTPFWKGSPTAAPAGGLFLLEHAPTPRVQPVAPARCLAEVLQAGGAPLALPAVQQAFFDAAARLIKRIPTYRLAFAPDPGFWRAIDSLPEFSFFRPRRPAPTTLPKATAPAALGPIPLRARPPGRQGGTP
ncbi:MAG: hypothetical protein Q9Q40_02675 [Acidobacteriota bacterium]|nr:hypothetical protein [Acidobacteriota bacterium]